MDYNDIKVLYEDNHVIVAVKPQGVPSQSDVSGDGDMLSMMKSYIKEKYEKPGNVYLGLVHRLDRPTGGVMVFARTSKAAARLSEQIRDGSFGKKYLAALTARPGERKARLVHYLLKDSSTNMVRVVPMTTEGAKKAVLEYNVLESREEEGLYLADVRLFTGRSHQIRVQMATIGCPIYGDIRYGNDQQYGHLALWSYDLSFRHPTTDKRMIFRVFPPDEYPWNIFNLERQIGIVRPAD